MRCHNCGSEVPLDARRCPQCGTEVQADQTGTISIPVGTTSGVHEEHHSVSELSVEDRSAVDALPQGSALLIVQRGPSAGSRFLLDEDEVIVGRHPQSEIFLDDVTVSRRHAVFRRTGATYTVEDVGSLNGTYVNRDRVDSYQLTNGDEVQIGKFRLIFFTAVNS